MKTKNIGKYLWAIYLIIILSILLCSKSFGQLDITKENVTVTENFHVRSDTILNAGEVDQMIKDSSVFVGGVPTNAVLLKRGDSIYGSENLKNNDTTLIMEFGTGNIFIGVDAGLDITTGTYNNVLGHQALSNITTGDYNTAIGRQASFNNRNGDGNTAIGMQALYSDTNSFGKSTAVGMQALYSNTSGYDNTAVGYQSLYTNTTGFYNSAFGFDALYHNIIGNSNTATGIFTLQYNTGSFNTGVGRSALEQNTSGSGNIGIGNFAGSNVTTQSNRLYINSIDRTDVLGDTTLSIIYGYQSAATVNQELYLNAHVYVSETLTVDSIYTLLAGVWADTVFYDDYKVIGIKKEMKFAREHKHLKDMPPGDQNVSIDRRAYANTLLIERLYIYVNRLHTYILILSFITGFLIIITFKQTRKK